MCVRLCLCICLLVCAFVCGCAFATSSVHSAVSVHLPPHLALALQALDVLPPVPCLVCSHALPCPLQNQPAWHHMVCYRCAILPAWHYLMYCTILFGEITLTAVLKNYNRACLPRNWQAAVKSCREQIMMLAWCTTGGWRLNVF